MMRPSTKDVKAEKKISSRYAAMYVPNLTWDFYDAFTNSEPTRIAHSCQTISTADNTLQKYLLAARNRELKRNREIANEGVIQLPRYLKIMKQLQSDNGKFDDLHILLKLLELPKGCMDNFSLKEEWERATYLAIAVYRLNPDYFEQLRESYDRAVVWAPANQPIYEARNILLTQAGDGYEPPSPEDANADSSGSKPKDPMKELEKMAANRPKTPSKQPLDTEEPVNISHTTSPPKPLDGFGHLQTIHAALAIDDTKVARQREIVEAAEQRVIHLHDRLEVLVVGIIDCLKRCVDAYNACDLFIDRYRKFDELTARLSDGFVGSPAYEDWRRDGVPSYRDTVVSFFNAVHVMAEERLTLQELLQPKGRDWTQKADANVARKRWSIVFNGDNLVLKVVHYLDFLRKCRELSDWYGNGFYFAANPLMLPFPVSQAKELFKLGPLISDHLQSLPYDRKGIADPVQRTQWRHQQFLNDFRRRFFDACKNRVFNWPTLPNIREEAINSDVCTAFLVMFICAEKSIQKTNDWEKEFIGQISSMRGAATLLVGKPNRKEDKPLLIPPVESRKARPAIFGIKTHNATVSRVKKTTTGDDTKSKASLTNRSHDTETIDDDTDMDDSLFEQFFLQQDTVSPPNATHNNNDDNDNDDDDDSYDDNGQLKLKRPKSNPATHATPAADPCVAINRHTERRHSKIAKAQAFQQYLTDAKTRKDLKLALAASDQQHATHFETQTKRLRGKDTMLNLATHGARKSVLINRGVPMMGMNLIAALNTDDTGTHKLLVTQENSVETQDTGDSSSVSPVPNSRSSSPQKPRIKDSAAGDTVAAAGHSNSPATRRHRQQRSPSRIHVAPPGLVGMTRKSSVASSAVLLARRTSSAGHSGSAGHTASAAAGTHTTTTTDITNETQRGTTMGGGFRNRNSSVLLVSRKPSSALVATPSLSQIHETSVSSQSQDTLEDDKTQQARLRHKQQALTHLAALRQSSPLLNRGATPLSAGARHTSRASVVHPVSSSPPKATATRVSRASVARVALPPSALLATEVSQVSCTSSSSTLPPLKAHTATAGVSVRRVSSAHSIGRKASTVGRVATPQKTSEVR